MVAQKIGRKIKMSASEVEKQKLDPPTLLKQGWVLKDDWYYLVIQVPQLVEKQHADGGTPDVGTPSLDDLLNGVMALVNDHGIPIASLCEYINNGVYLAFNARSKPSSAVTLAGIRVVFATHATPAEQATFFTKMGTGTADEYLKDWFAKRPAVVSK